MGKKSYEERLPRWKIQRQNAIANGETISNQEEMMRVSEEMRDRRLGGEIKNELLEYVEDVIPQWEGFNKAGRITFFGK